MAASEAVIDSKPFGEDTNALSHLVALMMGIVAKDGRAARSRAGKIEQKVDSGRFACAIRAEESIDFALAHGEVKIVHSNDIAVAFGYAVEFDGGHIWQFIRACYGFIGMLSIPAEIH